VPAVRGNSQAEADSNLRNARLTPQFKNVNGADDETVRTAISQKPAGGASVPVNTTVVVEINVGPKTATIPKNLVGKDKDEVVKKLRDAGFTNPKLVPAETEPNDADKDEVLSVLPIEGESAALSEDITITYATGQSPVPLLTQRTRSQAEADAEAAGFDKVRFTRKESDQLEGLVIEQSPEAGKRVDRSTTLKLTVAEPKPPSAPTTPPATTQQPADPSSTASSTSPSPASSSPASPSASATPTG
jgi:serine/threonine-protein kinase